MANLRKQSVPESKELLASYIDYLLHHRGLCARYCHEQRKVLSEFLGCIAGRNFSLQGLKAQELDVFLQSVSESGKSKEQLSVYGKSLRGFLRYLFSEGRLREDKSSFVEMPRIYRDASVPPHFTWAEIEQLLASVTADTPIARCDRAMLALLCTYGLRSGELVRLTLDDLDWNHKLMRIKRRKGGSVLTLPLVPAVEAALSQYLIKGRPNDAPFREVLLTRSGRPFQYPDVIARLHILVANAGLKGGRGAHAIRRAVGTRLVEQGLGAGAVAIVVGHENPNSVRTYLRLSIESLREVADNYGDLL